MFSFIEMVLNFAYVCVGTYVNLHFRHSACRGGKQNKTLLCSIGYLPWLSNIILPNCYQKRYC